MLCGRNVFNIIDGIIICYCYVEVFFVNVIKDVIVCCVNDSVFKCIGYVIYDIIFFVLYDNIIKDYFVCYVIDIVIKCIC